MDEIATFSRWKAFFGFFLMRKKKHPSQVERAKKKEEIIWESQQIEEALSMSSPRKNQKTARLKRKWKRVSIAG